MIKKNFELSNCCNDFNFFLFYGENIGLIEDLINENFKSKFKENYFHYQEKKILDNPDIFYENLLSNSFFEKTKLIVISDISDKSLDFITTILEKNINDVKIIFKTKILDKKSKIRKFFEKEKNLIIVPCYQDNYYTLAKIADNFLKKSKLSIPSNIRNIVIEKSGMDRKNLKNQLNKIYLFLIGKNKINNSELLKLIDVTKDNDLNELANNYLSKNKKKIINILNDSKLYNEDIILFVKLLLNKTKRLEELKKNSESNNNLDMIISRYKPPIFWKEKDIIRQQLDLWSKQDLRKLIRKFNILELNLKKKFEISNLLLNNFILELPA